MNKYVLHSLIFFLTAAGNRQKQAAAFAKGADVGWLPQMEATA